MPRFDKDGLTQSLEDQAERFLRDKLGDGYQLRDLGILTRRRQRTVYNKEQPIQVVQAKRRKTTEYDK